MLLLHINQIYEGLKITPMQGHNLPMNSAYPRTSQAPKLPLFRATALPMKRALFPFEGVHLRHLDWLSVNIIFEAKSPFAGRRGLGLALNDRPGL